MTVLSNSTVEIRTDKSGGQIQLAIMVGGKEVHAVTFDRAQAAHHTQAMARCCKIIGVDPFLLDQPVNIITSDVGANDGR